jgi:glycosyltransferase involved in cell wall biosynthesis
MQNRGVSLWRNTWAKHAKYNDILFLDADTDIEETFIEELITQISKYCIDVWTMKFKSRSKNFRYKIWTFLANTFMKWTSFVSPTWVWACMYSKKDVFNNIEWFDERITLCEDCDYFNRAQKKWYKFKVIPLYFYFDMRRLEQDGIYKTFFKYLHANIYRFTKRELINDERFDYKFWHYKK